MCIDAGVLQNLFNINLTCMFQVFYVILLTL